MSIQSIQFIFFNEVKIQVKKFKFTEVNILGCEMKVKNEWRPFLSLFFSPLYVRVYVCSRACVWHCALLSLNWWGASIEFHRHSPAFSMFIYFSLRGLGSPLLLNTLFSSLFPRFKMRRKKWIIKGRSRPNERAETYWQSLWRQNNDAKDRERFRGFEKGRGIKKMGS